MEIKHTPGPWSLADSPETADGTRTPDGTWIDINARGLHAGLARVVWRMEDDNRSPEKEANAYLIAAAPDLLEALQFVVRWHDQLTPADVERFKAVIAKATGVQP